MVIISSELTMVKPDRNIFLINVELTSTFLKSFYLQLCLYIAINEQRRPLSRHPTTMFCGTHFSNGLTQKTRD